ncbi:MAG: hypothetical protein LQ346_007532 [Caloplaca aetnensis]|nr:MAG: hypothetical protein LQ346_007532 [Caloplaca aetnensis]
MLPGDNRLQTTTVGEVPIAYHGQDDKATLAYHGHDDKVTLAYHGHDDNATHDHHGHGKGELDDANSALGHGAESPPSPRSSNTTSSSPSSPSRSHTEATENTSDLDPSERSNTPNMDDCSNTNNKAGDESEKDIQQWEKEIEQWIYQADSSQDPAAAVLEKATECLAHAPLGIQNRWRIFKILLQAAEEEPQFGRIPG